jgi:hypothetical protein
MRNIYSLFRLTLLCCLLLQSPAFSQPEGAEGMRPVNYKKIRKECSRKRSPHYFPRLYERYLALDTSLTAKDFRYLYYGFSFQPGYKPYETPPLRDSLISFLGRDGMTPAEYELAGHIAAELLAGSPFRLRETFIAAMAFQMAGNEAMSAAWFHFYQEQADAILGSGDGLTPATAFSVIYIPDEYEIMELLGLQFGGTQALIEEHYDMLEVEENRYGIDALYFDVKRLLEAGFRK